MIQGYSNVYKLGFVYIQSQNLLYLLNLLGGIILDRLGFCRVFNQIKLCFSRTRQNSNINPIIAECEFTAKPEFFLESIGMKDRTCKKDVIRK